MLGPLAEVETGRVRDEGLLTQFIQPELRSTGEQVITRKGCDDQLRTEDDVRQVVWRRDRECQVEIA